MKDGASIRRLKHEKFFIFLNFMFEEGHKPQGGPVFISKKAIFLNTFRFPDTPMMKIVG